MITYSFLLSASIVLAATGRHTSVESFQNDGWRLSVRNDHFTGLTICHLASVKEPVSYQPGAVGFNLGAVRDTVDVWYRIDGGPSLHWQDKLSQLVLAGVELDGSGLDDPTAGWVWVPIGELTGARIVEIRGNDRSRVRRFRLRSFSAMLDAARRLGCSSDGTFRS